MDTAFRERLVVPVRWWIQGALLIATCWLAMVVAIPWPAAAGITAGLMALLATGLWAYGSAQVIVRDGWLLAGRARIELEFIGAVHALDATQTRQWSGRFADARAFLVLRPYLTRAVRIEIDDHNDPTPYWLVSSRHPARLAAALDDTRRCAVQRDADADDNPKGMRHMQPGDRCW